MTEDSAAREMERIQRERDLYLRLLELGSHKELDPFLKEALALVVEVTGARQGYLEVRDEPADEGDDRWSIAHGLTDDEVDGVRTVISRGIIAEVIATGQTIETPSAMHDPRFRKRTSVRRGTIGAVLCAPIGVDPPLGVLYLEGRGDTFPFAPQDRVMAELFARHLAPLVDRLLVHRRVDPDPTAGLREKLRMDGIVGRSRALAVVLRQVALVAPLEVNVLLTGESGTGKSQLARLIRENGPRRRHAFVELNCAAVNESLFESEFFGAVPGAYTGAPAGGLKGKVAAAEHGTLFLDEVGELLPALQAKLLHLLQSKEYYPVGANKSVKADVRIIAATNVDLEKAVAEHRFREDLFYRLQVLPVRVPSLAERREDVPELAEAFCAEACTRHGLSLVRLSRGAIRAVQSAEWPGNVRQLAHAIEAAAIRAAADDANEVGAMHVFPGAASFEEEALIEVGPSAGDRPRVTFQDATRRFQAKFLREQLEEEQWNVSEVARRLDLGRSHIYNLVRAFGLGRNKP